MKVKRAVYLWGLAALLTTLLFGAGALAKKIEMSMSTIYMGTHPTVVNAWTPWFKEMADLTHGDIEITYFNPNTLCPVNDSYDATISGMVGIGGNGQSMTPGKFPLSGVLELPGMAPSAECGSLVMWELYKNHPEIQAEYKDIQVLWMWASATYQLHTTKKLVKTLEDAKGLKIIAWNRAAADVISALGANPVQIGTTDTYLALERGMADGVLCPLAPIVSYKISEATKYTTVCDILLNPFWAGMSHDLWKSLNAEDKAAFEKTTGEAMAKRCGVSLDKGAISDAAKLRGQGRQFYLLPNAERDRWVEATAPLRAAWVKNMEAKGYKNASQLLKETMELSAKYAKTTGRGYEEK